MIYVSIFILLVSSFTIKSMELPENGSGKMLVKVEEKQDVTKFPALLSKYQPLFGFTLMRNALSTFNPSSTNNNNNNNNNNS